jgi:hypothetical protein
MSYKTIVVHVDRSIHANGRMQYAAQLAARTGAHLVGSAFSGISRYVEAGVEVILAQQAAQREGNEPRWPGSTPLPWLPAWTAMNGATKMTSRPAAWCCRPATPTSSC